MVTGNIRRSHLKGPRTAAVSSGSVIIEAVLWSGGEMRRRSFSDDHCGKIRSKHFLRSDEPLLFLGPHSKRCSGWWRRRGNSGRNDADAVWLHDRRFLGRHHLCSGLQVPDSKDESAFCCVVPVEVPSA